MSGRDRSPDRISRSPIRISQRRRALRAAVSLALAAAALLGARAARAQELLYGATFTGATGVEGGARDVASGIRRARTLLSLGGDARVDESPRDVFRVVAQLELEPSAAFGARAGYARRFGERFEIGAYVTGFLAPETLVGVAGGLTYDLPLADGASLTFGPSVPVYFVGSDLPSGTILWQALFQAGIRLDLD
jgi:hypothetical protein